MPAMQCVVVVDGTAGAQASAASLPGRRRRPGAACPPGCGPAWGRSWPNILPIELRTLAQFGKYLVEKERPEWAEQYVGAWAWRA